MRSHLQRNIQVRLQAASNRTGHRYWTVLAPIIQKLNNAIHGINLYLVDNETGLPNTYPCIEIYPVDINIQRLNNPGLVMHQPN